ncbi:MAG TPA: hypothetical protein VF147_10180, partial [Vicinamibacterales bacterium]
ALASAPADTQQTQGDQLFTFEPFGTLEYVSPRTEFTGGYRGNIRRYMDVNQLNGFDQRGFVSLKRQASRRLSFFVSDSYAHVPTTDEVELNGVPFTRTGSRTNTAAAGVEGRLNRFTSLAVRYDLSWVDFDRTDTLLTGGFVNAVRANVSHAINERTHVGGEYGIRLADLNEGTRQVTFQDAGGTLGYALGPHTDLSLAGGVSFLNDRTLNESRTGPYVRAGITHATDRLMSGVSFERSFVPSFGFGGSSQSEELRTFVRMPFQQNRLYVDGSAAWRRSNPFIAQELKLDTIWLRSTVGYGLTRWLRLEGYYAFTRQDSQVTGGEINRHRAGMQVVLSQPMRIR